MLAGGAALIVAAAAIAMVAIVWWRVWRSISALLLSSGDEGDRAKERLSWRGSARSVLSQRCNGP
jgi:hypothetical protein